MKITGDFVKTISELRKEIDQVHKELYSLLERRRDLTCAVWDLKVKEGLPFFDSEREEQIVREFVKLSRPQASESELDKVSAQGELVRDQAFEDLLRGVMGNLLREYEKYLKTKY